MGHGNMRTQGHVDMGHSPFSPPLRVPCPPAAPHHQVDVVELQAQWAALPHQQPPPLPRGHCCVLPCTSTHQYESSQLSQYHPVYSHIVPVWLRDPPSTRVGGLLSQHPLLIPQLLPVLPVYPFSLYQSSQSTQSQFPVIPSPSQYSLPLPVLPFSPSSPSHYPQSHLQAAPP